LSNKLRELKLFHCAFSPRSEPTSLTVVSVIAKSFFGSDIDDFLVQKDHTTVVKYISVEDWHADIADHVLGESGFKYFAENFPRMLHGIEFVEMIFTIVTRDLKFGADTVCAVEILGNFERIHDSTFVSFEI
jgi:hypothetical protein